MVHWPGSGAPTCPVNRSQTGAALQMPEIRIQLNTIRPNSFFFFAIIVSIFIGYPVTFDKLKLMLMGEET